MHTATQNGRDISILPSASSLQERASSRSRAVDGSMVKIQSFLGKIEDIISDVTNNRNFTMVLALKNSYFENVQMVGTAKSNSYNASLRRGLQ